MKGILGYKRGMARVFDDEGPMVPVTVIEAGPCTVTQVRPTRGTATRRCSSALGPRKPARLTKAGARPPGASGGGAAASSAGVSGRRRVGRSRWAQTFDVSQFAPGDRVDVTGVSRGLGLAGTIKRHHFKRQRKTHGQSDRERAPGAVGAGTTPGRTFKGKRMAGRMGGERVTVRNLVVVVADPARNLLAVRGAVPGFDGGLVAVRSAKEGQA